MSDNRVSASLSKEDREAVLTAFNTIKTKLTFLIDLTKEERVALPKMGDKSRVFVTKALEVATQNPEFLPRSFDLEEMRKDTELFEAMYPIMLASNQLHELIEDTVMEVGSEAYAAALVVYSYAKASDKGAGLDGVVDEMAKRFARKNSKKNKAETPTV